MTDDQFTTYPAYLNAGFFKRCLSYKLGENGIQIKSVNLSPGSGTGENYASAIYRAFVAYTTENNEEATIPLIIKSISAEGNREYLDSFDVYGKEVTMYFKVLPYIHENLNGDRVAPRCHYATTDPVRTIVFDDLKAEGYFLKDRRVGLDEDHSVAVLRKIAKFHAASLPFINKEPLNQEAYKYGFFDPKSAEDELHQVFFRKNLKRAAEMVLQMPGYEHFAPKLMKMFDNFVEKAYESVKHDATSITVLNHGDLWVNNMLFKYDDEGRKPVDVILIDYQMNFVNSLGLDLHYFFVTSAQVPVLERQEELLTTHYYPILVETMKQIRHESIPTLDQVLREAESRSLYGFFSLFGVLPLYCLEEDAITDNYADFLDETLASKARNAGMSSPRFIATMQYALKYYEKINLFD